MIYYRLNGVSEDGTPNRHSYGRYEKLSNANDMANALATRTKPIAVVKVTEQHLGTFRSKANVDTHN